MGALEVAEELAGAMKVLVCGSRAWNDSRSVAECLHDLKERHGEGLLVIHGACRGPDMYAEGAAWELGIPTQAFPADWRGLGKRAGFVRNVQMLDENPDLVIAFQRNGSRGTQHTIDEARKRGIPVEVHSA